MRGLAATAAEKIKRVMALYILLFKVSSLSRLLAVCVGVIINYFTMPSIMLVFNGFVKIMLLAGF